MFQYPRPTTTNPRPAPILSHNCCYLSLTVDFCRQLFLSCPLVASDLSATVPGLSRSVPNCSLLSPRTISFASRFPCCYTYTPAMPMSTPNRLRHALEKLAAEPPSTKTALIRSLLPGIEAALASGKTWKQVWQCLADDGLDISYETFRKVLQRVRKKARISAQPRGKSLEFPGVCCQEAADGVARDPLANVKRLEENRPGFHWRATPNQKGSDNGR